MIRRRPDRQAKYKLFNPMNIKHLMNPLKRLAFVAGALILSVAPILPTAQALAHHPEEGSAFDTLARNCQATFPMRRLDPTRVRTIVVERSTFCLYVLQRTRRGHLVATMATATSLGYDLRGKNGLYEVADIDVFESNQQGYQGSRTNERYYHRQYQEQFGAGNLTLRPKPRRNHQHNSCGGCYQQRPLLPVVDIHGAADPLDVGGLLWNVPGVTLRNRDWYSLESQTYPGMPAYVVNSLSELDI